MSEFDELVASPGVLMAGRFGADGRVAEHKTTGLYVENPALTGIAQWFCAAGHHDVRLDGIRSRHPDPERFQPGQLAARAELGLFGRR